MVVSEAIQTKVSGLPGCMYIDIGSVFVPLVASPIIGICWLEIECFKCLLSGSWPYNTSDDSVAMETGLIDEIGFYTVDVLLSLRFGRNRWQWTFSIVQLEPLNTFAWHATSWDRDTPNRSCKIENWFPSWKTLHCGQTIAYVCVYSQSWHELMSHKLSCSKSQQVLFESNSKYFRGKQDAVAFWNPNILFWRNHHAVVALAAAVGVRSKTKKTSWSHY